MSEERNCHKCPLLKKDYDKGVMHEKTLLYKCNDIVALTTNELQKGREEFCKMTDFMVMKYE